MRHPEDLPPHLMRAPFRVREAVDAGASRHRLRGEHVDAPFHGIRIVGDAPAPRHLAVVLAPILGPDQVFSHWTAAALLGMRLPQAARELPLHVTTLRGGRAMRRRQVVGHRADSPRDLRLTSEGIPVTAPIDTWCDLGAFATVDELIAIGDGLLARKAPMATPEQLAEAVEARAGHRGAARLARALPSIRPNTDSWRETVLRLLLMRAGLPEPEVNGAIRDGDGVLIAHGDLVWRAQRLIVEYDGRQHAEDPTQYAIDIRRLNRLSAAGWTVLRVDAELLRRPAVVVALVRRALARA